MSSSRSVAKHSSGGMKMDSRNYWQLFMETGAPELYLLYNQAKKAEGLHVLDDTGLGTEGYGL